MYSPIATDFSGQARVIDGDTIDVAGRRVRLEGIDAPESRQQCSDGERRYSCGANATSALYSLIAFTTVNCDDRGRDRYGRTLALCTANDVDVGRWMVRNGHALAYWRYSWRYGLDETLARISSTGVWVGDFERPEDWRRMSR
ncbi:MAG: thermonuclease family protein [Reyranellaceae bacterium]